MLSQGHNLRVLPDEFLFTVCKFPGLFLRLIDISGVGPKMAMQILSGADLNSLTVAIATGDVKSLSKIKGLGKKTAELPVMKIFNGV